jgi:hypothetical protein
MATFDFTCEKWTGSAKEGVTRLQAAVPGVPVPGLGGNSRALLQSARRVPLNFFLQNGCADRLFFRHS